MHKVGAEEGGRGDLRHLDLATPPQSRREGLLPAQGAKTPGPDSHPPSEGSGAEAGGSLHSPLEVQCANPDTATFLASLRACRIDHTPQVPAFLTRPEATENEVNILNHTQEGAVWATEHHIAVAPLEPLCPPSRPR